MAVRRWIPAAAVAIVVMTYALFYAVTALESQGASSFELVNTVGLLAVVFGVLAAAAILGRARPPA